MEYNMEEEVWKETEWGTSKGEMMMGPLGQDKD